MNLFLKKSTRALKVAWSRINDLYLNIETSDEPDSIRPKLYGLSNDMAKHKDGTAYQAADYRNIRNIIRVLAPNKDDVFFDLGCGKGRCVCVFARLPIRKAVGVELNHLLCEAARVNANRLRGKKTTVEIRCEDAAPTNLSNGTVYFMFNPFGEKTMRDVFSRVYQSLSNNPRKVTIVYVNPVLTEMFSAAGWLQKSHEFKTISGGRYTFWVNREF